MIGISRGHGSLGLPVVPAGAPAAAPAPGGVAGGAFDAAFADLTAALLATAAGAGQPAAGKAGATTGEAPIEASEASTAGDDTTANVAVAVPVVVPMPTPVVFVPVATAGGAAGDAATDTAVDAGATPRQTNTAALSTSGSATMGGAAISSEILGGEDVREQWVDETFTAETSAAEAGGDDTGDAAPVHTPVDPILPEGLRRQAAPLPSSPATGDAATGDAGPIHDAVDPILPPGLRRQAAPVPSSTVDGGELAAAPPAPAKTIAPSTAGAIAADVVMKEADAVEVAPPQTDDVASTSAAATAALAPPVTSGLARRAEALQRALGRRHDAEHGDTAPAGLAAQAARVDAAMNPQATGTGTGQGASEGESGDAAARGRRAARLAMPSALAVTPTPTPAATTNVMPAHGATDAAPTATSWRTAALAARFAEPSAVAADQPRPATAVPALAAGVLAAEMPALREVKAVVLDTVAHVPQDTAAADHVQMQIVKAMKLQWTGATQEARVQLKPEYLGEVVANIKVEQGVVTATLHADTPEVRRLLETQTASLRDALVEHGLKLDKVVIAEPETPSGQQGDRRSRGRQPQPESSRPKPRRPRAEGDGATFELSTE